MKKSVYKQVVKTIEIEEWDFDKSLDLLVKKFPDVRPETLRSILNQEYQKRVKRTHKHQTSEQKRREAYKAFVNGVSDKNYKEGVIVRIAKKNRFSPAQTGKIILEENHKRWVCVIVIYLANGHMQC